MIFLTNSTVEQIPASANITIGDIALQLADGLILLTNQYGVNDSLTGGDIVINGEGILERGISTLNFEGGTVFIDARNNIEVVNSAIITTSLGEVGDIAFPELVQYI